MDGLVDTSGRALVTVPIQSREGAAVSTVQAWIDTGFTGDLVLPKAQIEKLGLEESGTVDAVLADGSPIELNTYSCSVEWFGAIRQLEVVANDGEFPLLGVGMLLGLELRVNYQQQVLTLMRA